MGMARLGAKNKRIFPMKTSLVIALTVAFVLVGGSSFGGHEEGVELWAKVGDGMKG